MNNTREVEKDQLMAQIAKIEEEYRNEKRRSDNLRKGMMKIAEKCCDNDFAQTQLGGKNKIFALSDNELRDFVINNVAEQKQGYFVLINDLYKKLQELEKEKGQLAQKNIELQQVVAMNENNISDLYNLPTQVDKFDTNFKNDSIIENETNNIGSSTSSSNLIVMNGEAFSVQETLKSIDIYQEQLIDIIGTYGYSETKDIFSKAKADLDISETTLKNKWKDLQEKKLVEFESATTAVSKNRRVYALSELGKAIYEEQNGKKPVISQKDKLRQQHASISHAYCIKDTASILEALGYTSVTYDSSKNSYELPAGKRYVPDIVAKFKTGNGTIDTFWEVELAHHTDNDFFEKLLKSAQISKNVNIIASDAEAKKRLVEQVNKYYKYLIQNNIRINQTVYIGTIVQLKERVIFKDSDCKFQFNTKD